MAIKEAPDDFLEKIEKEAGVSTPPAQEYLLDEEKESKSIDDFVGKGLSEYKPLSFEDPIEYLYWLDDDLREGRRQLWDWQVETLLFIWKDVYDLENRLKFCLTAANGSGKDAYIIAPLASTQIITCVRSRFIGTSKSTHQLNTQTNCYIKSLCSKTGAKLRAQGYHERPFMYHSKPFHIACAFTGAEILSFVTDEAENVEGYHPWPDAPKARITIAINEAKGVSDEFFDGFSRCSFTRWIEVTSPGIKTGRNYEHFDKSVKYPEPYEKGKFYSRRITSYQCPHKSIKSIEEDAEDYGGKDSPLFRSKHLAEYTDVGESVVIGLDVIDKWIGKVAHDKDNFRAAGLDLSLGGDETVLVVREGNKMSSIDGVRIKDANILTTHLGKLFVNRGLSKRDPIFTDIGGLGKPIAQMLQKLGWNIIHVLNNNPAIGMDKHIYQNRGTEIYFEVCNYFARGFICVEKADKLWREQLGSRKFIRLDSDKVKMQPKRQIIADKDKMALSSATEWVSPDRADAFVLAFAEFEPRELKRKRDENPNRMKYITQKQLIDHMAENRFNGFKLPSGLDRQRGRDRGKEWLKQQLEQNK